MKKYISIDSKNVISMFIIVEYRMIDIIIFHWIDVIKAPVLIIWPPFPIQVEARHVFSTVPLSVNHSDRMEPLETPKCIFTLQCVYPAAKSTTKWKRIGYISFALMIFCGTFFGTVAHLAYLLKFSKIDFKGSIFACSGIIVFSGVMYIIVTIFVLRNQISAIFDNLVSIYDTCEYRRDLIFFRPFNLSWFPNSRQIYGFASVFGSCKRNKWMDMVILLQTV